jgi:hypothetical protein
MVGHALLNILSLANIEAIRALTLENVQTGKDLLLSGLDRTPCSCDPWARWV